VISYMAQPYSINSTPEIRERRYKYAVKMVAKLLNEGYNVFSPILNSHEPSVQHSLPCTWDFWAKIDKEYIAVCGEVIVLMMDEWEQSVGLAAEVEYAKAIGLPIKYVECKDEFVEEF